MLSPDLQISIDVIGQINEKRIRESDMILGVFNGAERLRGQSPRIRIGIQSSRNDNGATGLYLTEGGPQAGKKTIAAKTALYFPIQEFIIRFD